jgi:hypothetical protein
VAHAQFFKVRKTLETFSKSKNEEFPVTDESAGLSLES